MRLVALMVFATAGARVFAELIGIVGG